MPPAAVIARGTEGVFEFVRKVFRSGSDICVSGTVFAIDATSINLSGRRLDFDVLLPFLESFQQGKFLNLYHLQLVGSSQDESGSCWLSLVCCRMEMGLGTEARR